MMSMSVVRTPAPYHARLGGGTGAVAPALQIQLLKHLHTWTELLIGASLLLNRCTLLDIGV